MERTRDRAVVVVRHAGAEVARWGVPLDDRPDLVVLDELAKVALATTRAGDDLTVHVFCPRLASLIDLAGLTATLGAEGFGSLLGGEG